jgi:ABC-type molybdenum transport system ATPase subunit/photorepair protein PhrA
MAQAREAERLSLTHEKATLLAEGISENPKWVGLDDNFAGYDVLSYERGEHGLINKLIEVKSTTASPLRFYISRNEWDTAKRAGRAYLFHIWDMSKVPPIMYMRTVAQIEPHVPSDNEDGKWSNMEVPLGA